MATSQSPRRPVKRLTVGIKDAGWLIAYSWNAARRLFRARLQFRSFSAKNIATRNEWASSFEVASTQAQSEHLERITYVMARISKVMPFRSDCLVQSAAAQDWLAEGGLTSEMQIGIDTPVHKRLEAHAWLLHDNLIVTGGDIKRYDLLLGDSESHGIARKAAEEGHSD